MKKLIGENKTGAFIGFVFELIALFFAYVYSENSFLLNEELINIKSNNYSLPGEEDSLLINAINFSFIDKITIYLGRPTFIIVMAIPLVLYNFSSLEIERLEILNYGRMAIGAVVAVILWTMVGILIEIVIKKILKKLNNE